jgi:hypothetical protein
MILRLNEKFREKLRIERSENAEVVRGYFGDSVSENLDLGSE